MLPALPTKVWSAIADRLIDAPVIGQASAASTEEMWKRQRTLASLVRVNKAVNEAVLPILYAEPLVANVTRFLSDTSNQFRRPARELLKHARTLHLTLPDAKGDKEYIIAYCSDLILVIRGTLAAAAQSASSPRHPFPNVQCITLGRYPTPDITWSTFHLDVAGSPRQSVIALTQRFLFAFMFHLHPRTIYQYTLNGPLAYSLLTLDLAITVPKGKFTTSGPKYKVFRQALGSLPPGAADHACGEPDQTVVYQAVPTSISFPVIRNVQNRWEIVYDLNELSTYDTDQTESRLNLSMTLDLAGSIKRWREKGLVSEETRLVIAGLGAPLRVQRDIWRSTTAYRREMAHKHPLPVAVACYNRRMADAAEARLAETANMSEEAERSFDTRTREDCAGRFWAEAKRLVLLELGLQSTPDQEAQRIWQEWEGRIKLVAA